MGQNQLNRLKMVQVECPMAETPVSHPILSSFTPQFSSPALRAAVRCSRLLLLRAPNLQCMYIKKWFIMGGWVKRWTNFGTISALKAANGPF